MCLKAMHLKAMHPLAPKIRAHAWALALSLAVHIAVFTALPIHITWTHTPPPRPALHIVQTIDRAFIAPPPARAERKQPPAAGQPPKQRQKQPPKQRQKIAAKQPRPIPRQTPLAPAKHRSQPTAPFQPLPTPTQAAEPSEQTKQLIARIRDLIKADVENNWQLQPTFTPAMQCKLRVRLHPNGEVQRVQVIHPSGNATFDRAAAEAIHLASPLPVSVADVGSQLFQARFREFDFRFQPGI